MSDEAQNEHDGEGEGRRRRARHEDTGDAAALVDQWWNDHVPGSVVAGNTEIYNHMHAAKEDLKRRLARR